VPTNILTVDLEDWFVVENLRNQVSYAEWDELPLRIEENTRRLLRLFQRYRVRATFFVLGWIAEKKPELIAEIAYAGHEIACHSFAHARVDSLDEGTFKRDTERAIDSVVKATGMVPMGYRAPSWSINSRLPWAFEVLAGLGFKYDSSIYPVKHDIYGEPSAPRNFFKMQLDSGRILYELPASTVRFWGRNIPVGGGGYLRLAPYWFTSSMIRRINGQGWPAIVYIHPWELDENQPRMKGLSAFQKYRQYGSIPLLKMKLGKLLSEFDFMAAGDYVDLKTKKKIGFES